MSVAAFHGALKAQITADAALKAWAQGDFKRNLTAIDGNREIASIQTTEYPAVIFDLDAGENAPSVITNAAQETVTAVQVGVAWYEKDASLAFSQRVALIQLMIDAVKADGTLGGAIDAAWVQRWEPFTTSAPNVFLVRFSVRGEFYS